MKGCLLSLTAIHPLHSPFLVLWHYENVTLPFASEKGQKVIIPLCMITRGRLTGNCKLSSLIEHDLFFHLCLPHQESKSSLIFYIISGHDYT